MAKTDETYKGNKNLKPANVLVEFGPTEIKEFRKCMKDPIYFTEKYVEIVTLDKGLIPCILYEFQKDIIRNILDNRYTICKLPRQYGKTTAVVAIMLWYVLFHENYKIAILAHKETQAIEIMTRLRTAYQYLPKWLQQGIVQGGWNKKSLDLENGSTIYASATSESAIRGQSINLVYLDEFAHVPNNIQEEFYNSILPVISSGTTAKISITSTPKGMNMFYKIWVEAEEKRNSFIPLEVLWTALPGRDEAWKAEQIANSSERQFAQEYETQFLGSMNTLIDAKKLRLLAGMYKTPIVNINNVAKYYEPIEKHAYLIVVDTSRGVGIDYSAFVVFDITEIPYRVVAVFHDNEISGLLYPNIIFSLAKHYNDAYVLVEINDNGQQVADILYNDLEYDNVLSTKMGGRSGQKLSGGFGSMKSTVGIRTSKQVKRIGCANLKSLIENDKLIIEDFGIIYELTRFVAVKSSYEAEEGEHDDLVMTCVLMAWLANQDYFKEFSDTDVRKSLYGNFSKELDDDMVPFGVIDRGDEEENNMTAEEAADVEWGINRYTNLEFE